MESEWVLFGFEARRFAADHSLPFYTLCNIHLHYITLIIIVVVIISDYRAEIVFGNEEDKSPSSRKVWLDNNGSVHVGSIDGLRFVLTRSASGNGFRVSRVAHLRVIAGASVIIRDAAVVALIPQPPIRKAHITVSVGSKKLRAPAFASSFGPSISSSAATERGEFRVDRPALPLLNSTFKYGCEIYRNDPTNSVIGKVVIVRRGNCDFARKANQAALGGAKAVIVVNTAEDEDITPSADLSQEDGMMALVPLLLVGNATGERIQEMLERGKGVAQISVKATDTSEENELINLGGYVVSNVRLKRN